MNKFYSLIILLLLCLPTKAQSRLDSLLYRLPLQPVSLWVRSQNPAALSGATLPEYGVATAFANGSQGRFRRVQEAATDLQAGLYAEGLRHLGGWSYYGDFSYGKRWQQELGWAGTDNPLSGNPFTWADSLSGDWAKDFLETNLQVSSPSLFGRLKAGIGIHYRIGQGARALEPKPFFRSRDLALRPGLTYRLSEGKLLGAFAEVRYTFEEQEMGFYSRENALVYRIRGAGTFTRTPLVNAERQTNGSRQATGIQYEAHWQAKRLQLNAQVQQRREEVQEKAMQPLPAGTFKELAAEANADFSLQGERHLLFANLRYTYTNGQGIDPVFFTANALHSSQIISAVLGIAHGEIMNATPVWGLSLQPQIAQLLVEDRTARVSYDITSASATLKGHVRFQLFRYATLTLQPEAGYNHVPAATFEAFRNNIIVRQITAPDYRVLSASYWQSGLLTYLDVPVKTEQRVRLSLGMQHLQPGSIQGSRSRWNSSISFYY
ncbi:DUF6850 family outer membrane beta-barrel protein [Pontibacter sp. SGAir0037]|uniref:DUF6850 family outer membrane beta-barrel protein n=1 Tax=Pontibacter sp. SGAir0037 TaxID=2571030 RepID=UPI0010CD6645|nr:DUF6850 family outer membrane beta-barrel protein [Pontibacter sp. SGAir0037]QCR21624.1 hypothetical protein C1N53_04200 [Pontibacter sp. SGAir0037]